MVYFQVVDKTCIHMQISEKQSDIPVEISGKRVELDPACERHLCRADYISQEAIKERYIKYKENKIQVSTLGNDILA